MDPNTQHPLNLIHEAISMTLGLQKGKKSPLSPTATAILYQAHTKKLQVTDIARLFDIKKSTASGYVDNLEKKGYVTRVKDEANRRNTYVVPTGKGEKWLENKELGLAAYFQRHMVNLSATERQEFVRLLAKFVEEPKVNKV